MTDEKIAQVLELYKHYFVNAHLRPKQHDDGLYAKSEDDVLSHCYWMVIEAKRFLVQNRRDKAMRWLCFVQGCLFALKCFKIDELKNHNRP